FSYNELQAELPVFLSDITYDDLMKNFQSILPMTEYSNSFREFQASPPFFPSDINNDNLTENFQTVLPIIERSDNFKELQADIPFFLNNVNNDNLIERFKTTLPFFSNETDMVERNNNFKESTCSQNYYVGPSQEGIDIEPQNDMDVEFQGSIDIEPQNGMDVEFQGKIQPNLYKTVEIVTQLKQVDNNSTIVPDLHIFNQLRTPYAYTTETGQRVQKKVKYAYGFGKMKAALNLALDMGCEDELVDMISGFIDRKKTSLNNETDKNYENLHVLNPLVQKLRGRRPTKCIKSSTENRSQHISTRNSAINPINPNLYTRKEKSNYVRNTAVKTPLNALNSNSNKIDGGISAETSQDMKENSTKR
ncbi:8350_t:CDS:2, partial [Gigaspora margarita]